MQAGTIREVLNALDPEQALSTDEQLSQFFVARPRSPIEDLRFLLEDTTLPRRCYSPVIVAAVRARSWPS